MLDVGNSSVSGIVVRFTNSSGNCTINPTSSSLSCSSDEHLKKNISSLDTQENKSSRTVGETILDSVMSLRPVTYNWNAEKNTDPTHTGFIAQEVQGIFPDLVSEDSETSLLSLNYIGLIPYTVRALQQMNLQMQHIGDLGAPNTWRDSLLSWFTDTGNGIQRFFSKTITTQNICIQDNTGETCLTRSQLNSLLSQQPTVPVIVDESPAPTETEDAGGDDSESEDTSTEGTEQTPSDDTVTEDETTDQQTPDTTDTTDTTTTDENTESQTVQNQSPAAPTTDTEPAQ
jgi:hypothetical protein